MLCAAPATFLNAVTFPAPIPLSRLVDEKDILLHRFLPFLLSLEQSNLFAK